VSGCDPPFLGSAPDPFGRPRSILLPDGTSVTKSYDEWEGGYAIPYSDTREDTTTSNVGGGSIFRAIRRDILNRTILATEPVPSPPDGELPLTTYRYDIHDGLALVEATRRMTAESTVTQQRSYRRNVLGYLTSAQDPESGETTWTSYDALGNAKEKTTGSFSVRTDYDALGRPTRVYTPSGQEYVRSYYDGGEGGLVGFHDLWTP
jgi:YD repeat-containing protein